MYKSLSKKQGAGLKAIPNFLLYETRRVKTQQWNQSYTKCYQKHKVNRLVKEQKVSCIFQGQQSQVLFLMAEGKNNFRKQSVFSLWQSPLNKTAEKGDPVAINWISDTFLNKALHENNT